MTLCQVCNEEASKYKCPFCELPYCSLACYKIHKESHNAVPAPHQTHEAAQVVTNEAATNGRLENSRQEPEENTLFEPDSFSALHDSDELKKLFERYPQLRVKLHEIYEATLQPTAQEQETLLLHQQEGGRFDRGRGRGRGRGGGPPRQWTAERGLKFGKYRLANANANAVEGMADFEDLVLWSCPPTERNAGQRLDILGVP